MSRGIRRDTPERIAAAREQNPLGLGPWMGEVATKLNISAGLVARIVGAHEQTVLRWFFGQTPMQPQWLKASAQFIALLAWLESSGTQPLQGDMNAKMIQLKQYREQFVSLAKAAA